MTQNNFLKVISGLLLLVNTILIFLVLYKGKMEIKSERIVELETRVKIENHYTSKSSLAFSQLTNSLGLFEQMLISKGLLADETSSSYQVLIDKIDQVAGKFAEEELNTIPNYHELYMPSILSILVKVSFKEMLKTDCDCFSETVSGLELYLKGDSRFNVDELIPIIEQDDLEADIVRKFLLLKILQFT